MREQETWQELFDSERKDRDDTSELEFVFPEDLDWNRKFYGGYGGPEGVPFTAWTKERVYFPVVYDGAEWVESVPRNPCDEALDHRGGW